MSQEENTAEADGEESAADLPDSAPHRGLARVVHRSYRMMMNAQTVSDSTAAKSTRRASARHRYSIGELVSAAYKSAELVTRDERVVPVIASEMLATWLARSNHPEVLAQIRALAS